MQVKVRFAGLFRHYTGVRDKAVELPEGAAVSDLFLVLGREFGTRLPANMWDTEAERFHPLIKASRKGSPFMEEGDELRDGDEIFLISRMAGG
jgi:molybdopterin converting factor small subunit